MSKRSFRTGLVIVVGTLALIVGILAFMVHRALAYPDEPHDGRGQDVEVEVRSGMSFPEIASMLSDQGVIDRPTWFRLYAMWNGDTNRVKAGKYLIADNLTPAQVLAKLVEGVKQRTIAVTLHEGENTREFFATIERAGVASARELIALARDKEVLAKYAITGDSLEGYLFPDTYRFRVPEKPSVVIERMLNRHRAVWNETVSQHARDLARLKDKLGWSDREVLILASIIEKEAKDPQELRRIAQVFVNRLTSSSFKPHKLQTDPTIRYGCLVPDDKSRACVAWIEMCTKVGKPPGCERLHRAQLDDQDNPYNTYAHEGLPPGPISNPGRAAIAAAMTPDGSDYFFFVATAKNSRHHVFARTAAEHDRNVQKYVGGTP